MNYIDISKLNSSLIDEQSGDIVYCKRQYSENRYFGFTGQERIVTDKDVAFIMRKLQEYGIEHAFACHVLKDGRPVLQHIGMGDFNSCVANRDLVKFTADKLDAKDVYMIHNHPSGALVFSSQDRQRHQELCNSLGDRMKGSIIINTISGKYAFCATPSSKEYVQSIEHVKEESENYMPVQVLEFDKQVFSKEHNLGYGFVIHSSQDVAAFCSSQRFGEREKSSLIIVNTKLAVTAHIQLPYSTFSRIRVSEVAHFIQNVTAACGGTSAILCSTGKIPEIVIKALNKELMRISNFCLTDVCSEINIKLRSACDEGVFEEKKQVSLKL